MIKEFEVINLNGRPPIRLFLNDDISILTGRNGAGKTSSLKLMWYMMSGNLERIISELTFSSAKTVTDSFSITITMQKEKKGFAEWKYDDYLDESNSMSFVASSEEDIVQSLNRKIIKQKSGSVFFPTFRRIEGGFSMSATELDKYLLHTSFDSIGRSSVQGAMANLSERLSVSQHRFIASISTKDIVDLLTKKYADVSLLINQSHQDMSQEITKMIQQSSNHAGSKDENEEATATLALIQGLVTENINRQEQLLSPFSKLNELVDDIFHHRGIKITERLTIGERNEAIASDLLSAGEKQMLSFLAYNALLSDSVIFIDEPEISLHVDWQRTLFPTLLSQNTGNQFIITTHSPFIYSKYADKELLMNSDRGE